MSKLNIHKYTRILMQAVDMNQINDLVLQYRNLIEHSL